MNGILVRIGIDHSYGHWNAPADIKTRDFVYVPIPEGIKSEFAENTARPFNEVIGALERFATPRGVEIFNDLGFPQELMDQPMHLDPDFDHLTYGDDGALRGSDIKKLRSGDLLVFYAGLRPTTSPRKPLVYGIVGLYVIRKIECATSIPEAERLKNAHTRKKNICSTDIVVYAESGVSGRLQKYISIGEYRERAYRVRHDLLNDWGGLSVENGYIQRSARPPRFIDTHRFYQWFKKQNVSLIAKNNE